MFIHLIKIFYASGFQNMISINFGTRLKIQKVTWME